MDARKSSIFPFQFVKQILQTITHLVQYTVLDIQFCPLNSRLLLYDTQKFRAFLSAMQAIAIIRLVIWKKTTSKCF